MILKGNQRSGARQLAIHLMNTQDNDHVSVHELRGFLGHDLMEALNEVYAQSRGTKCMRYLFSLSLSPPASASVDASGFERAIEQIEEKIGLKGQARAVVFHEKDGRRHAHCVWSRINLETMTAINLSHYKLKLRDMSRALYLEHGWKMPRGLVNSIERDPLNFTLSDWQQSKRMKRDPRQIKAAFQDAWAISDSPAAFAQALAARGYYLARGDRRSFVAVDLKGDVFAIARWTGVRTKAVEERLGDPQSLPTTDEMSAELSQRLSDRLKNLLAEAEASHLETARRHLSRRQSLVQKQRIARDALAKHHAERRDAETVSRMARFPKGLRGIWSRITGQHRKIIRLNEEETLVGDARDRAEVELCINRHLADRKLLHDQLRRDRAIEAAEMRRLHRDIAHIVVGPTRSAAPLLEPIEKRPRRRSPD